MSKDAIASVYTQMLNDDEFRDRVADDPGLLDDFDLSDEEKDVLREEAQSEVQGFALGSGPFMSHLSARRGPPLTPSVASGLGAALNLASGLPVGALHGPGWVSNAACCPWGGHGAIPDGSMVQ